ncbi:MAG: hypothetical protein JO063_07790 [Pseudonocardiales bacterium]|nr:hypothetical protein [Pseudonocardiales bacterium]MBV9028702.1 hypothetical protein [Pseudonocardiales bacterium]MBW0010003.1 hypothetical protein [Pseudonocardiales bacterium]
MTTATVYGQPQDAWHAPLARGQRLAQDVDLPLDHHRGTIRTEPEGRAA